MSKGGPATWRTQCVQPLEDAERVNDSRTITTTRLLDSEPCAFFSSNRFLCVLCAGGKDTTCGVDGTALLGQVRDGLGWRVDFGNACDADHVLFQVNPL